MSLTARIELDGKHIELPIVIGTEGERAVDISTLRDSAGAITLDGGYANTGSCTSRITFIDGDKGILRYRGIPIEELAEKATFVETAYLLIYGKLPAAAELQRFSNLLTQNENLHPDGDVHGCFCHGRMPGWIANYKEIMDEPGTRIYRPRQIYMGPTQNPYVPLEERS